MYDEKHLQEKRIAVLIDLENVGLSSMQHLFEQVSEHGRIIVKRAYADWSRASKSREQMLELGIEPIQLFRSASRKKNSNDILLAIDAIGLLYSSPIDVFVIVSSDSDFIPLIVRLRASGKTVFCAGEQAKMPSDLVKACDKTFHIDQDENADDSEKLPVKNRLQKQSLTSQQENNPIDQTEKLWKQIDLAWSERTSADGQSIPGPNAAEDAARILGVAKLSASSYRTLQGILNASSFLSGKWLRDKNTIIRR